ncbi:MAG: hypothetical protein ACRCXL_15700 [Dermatophilaceae bacterium]
MGKGFNINRQAIREMSQEIEKEFAKNPVRVPLESDASGVRFPAATVTNNYHGPVVTVHGDNAQLAWDNQMVSQTQNQDIARGYEELAKVVTGLLASLPALGLSDDDEQEAKSTAETVLGEVVKDEPDQGRIKRGITMLRGLLAPIGTGVGTAVSDESAELAKTVIKGLGSTLPF